MKNKMHKAEQFWDGILRVSFFENKSNLQKNVILKGSSASALWRSEASRVVPCPETLHKPYHKP